MTNQAIDFNALLDASRKALAPAARLNELTVRNVERLARQQYAFMGELLEFGIKQAQLASTSKDVAELAARQTELNSAIVERATQHSQDLVKLATESQAEVSKWFDEAAADYVPAAKKKAA